jgi:transposase
MAMQTPLPPIHDTAEALRRLLQAAREAQRQQRLQALYLLQTHQARTRRQVAQLLGVNRDTVGRWLATYARGGIPQLLTIAKAPGKPPLLSEGMRQALQERLAQPQGFGSYQAIGPWLRRECGVPLAYQTVQKLVRYTLRAKLTVPRQAQIKNTLRTWRPCRRRLQPGGSTPSPGSRPGRHPLLSGLCESGARMNGGLACCRSTGDA